MFDAFGPLAEAGAFGTAFGTVVAAFVAVTMLLIRRLTSTPELRARGKTEALEVLIVQYDKLQAQFDTSERRHEARYSAMELKHASDVAVMNAKHDECEKRYDKLFEEMLAIRFMQQASASGTGTGTGKTTAHIHIKNGEVISD